MRRSLYLVAQRLCQTIVPLVTSDYDLRVVLDYKCFVDDGG